MTVVSANRSNRKRFVIIFALALFVIAGVFWWLRIIGITKTATPSCGKEEHIHSEECMLRTLTCEITSPEGTSPEDTSESESEYISVDEPESEHDDGLVTVPDVHVHNDSCYTVVYNCDGNGNMLEEHEHSLSCYSDVNADVEAAEDWEASLPELTGIWNQDIVAIAQSQLGESESIDNYTVDQNGEMHGISRYGQWYGNPYGDWNAMFVCFCLNYAGIHDGDFPYNSGCYSWQSVLVQSDMWLDAASGEDPFVGELAFSDTDADGKADRVGIVVQVTEDFVAVIEGDAGNTVAIINISRADGSIIGYAAPAELSDNDILWLSMSDGEKVAYVIAEIDKLPSPEEVQSVMEAFDDAEDFDGMDAYYSSLYLSVKSVSVYYYQLTQELQASVTNRDVLLLYVDMFDITEIATAVQKPARDNTNDLEVINGVNTRSFIELNLYDYGDNINDLFYDKTTNTRTLYPGFQQNGGETTRTKFSRWGFGLGDNITTDLLAGVHNVTGSGALINSTYPGSATTYPGINLPASMRDDSNNVGKCEHVQIMDWTLGEDGYPVTHEGSISLKYLFNEDVKDPNGVPYANKMNNLSITGLFKYNPTTGVYSYNSRENHAQFDAATDSFTLYKQRITPNFILYPFGNFLPFNDIVHQSKKSNDINEAYFRTIANSALYKSQTLDAPYSDLLITAANISSNIRTPYANLANVLDSYIKLAKKTEENGGLGKGSNWTASDVYSVREADVPEGFVVSYDVNGYSFTVTNTSKLPHTGQLFWPIPVLSFGGLLIIMIGWVLLHSDKKR